MLATILSLAAEGGEEAAETVNPVLPTGPELFWGALFFAALWILMRYVLLPPVRAVMRQRDEQRLADEEGTERAKVEAEKVRRDYDATLAEALSGARTQVAELAGTAASKVLGRTVDPAVAQRIAETYLAPSEN